MSEPTRPDSSPRSAAPLRIEWGRWLSASWPFVVPPLIAALLAGIGWELYIEITNESKFVLPRPTAAIDALFSDLDRFAEEGARTLWVSLAGLGLGASVALFFAILMAHSVTLERALLPIAIMVKVTPIVALAPLFVIWFGFGWEPKVAIAALLAYFPILINAIVGLRDVDPRTLDFLRSVDASKREVFWALRMPSALPFLFAALKISATLSLIGAVVAEFFSAQQGGLGAVISLEQRNLELDEVFAAIIALTVIGVLLNTAIVVTERLTLSWHRSTMTVAG
jgi:NitT/TauT family transport system permease protein